MQTRDPGRKNRLFQYMAVMTTQLTCEMLFLVLVVLCCHGCYTRKHNSVEAFYVFFRLEISNKTKPTTPCSRPSSRDLVLLCRMAHWRKRHSQSSIIIHRSVDITCQNIHFGEIFVFLTLVLTP